MIIGTLVGIVVFLVGWGYAIAHFGFFLGFGLGWIPAGVIAIVVDILVSILVTFAFAARGRDRES